ncbi:MAG TPA: methyltransferase [Clostridiales bacterium]|nr:methyltransferase [Clostridiales bacterium]
MVIRLLLATLFGGIIGFERENPNRPAGFRTHILVCVASSLVMLTSQFMFLKYQGSVTIDPTRLGAQVISGIGFLGAGTIIKDDFKVRGLTTAASLWSVACIGLAVGGGYFVGAGITTIILYLTLLLLKKVERKIPHKNYTRAIYITMDDESVMLEKALHFLGSQGISIESIDFNRNTGSKNVLLKVLYNEKSKKFDQPKLVGDLYSVEGVHKVTHD